MYSPLILIMLYSICTILRVHSLFYSLYLDGDYNLGSRDPSLTMQAHRMLSTMQAELHYISLLGRRDLF